MKALWPYVAAGFLVGVGAFLAAQGVDLLPFLLLAALGVVVLRFPALRGQGASSPVKVMTPGSVPEVAFDEIGGQEVAKKELLEALDFVTRQAEAERLGIRPLKGILLTGPPGTGKTLLAKAAAAYTGSAFLPIAGSEFIEMYAGVGAQRVRELFRRAKKAARGEGLSGAVVFIDEIEVVAPRRGQHHGHLEYDQTVNQLLVEMDGLGPTEDVQVLVMAATNRSDLLDPAILRPGRFDRIVKVDLPDQEGRLRILEIHTRNKPLADDVDLGAVARATFGFSGAHLESVANEAAILAFREGSNEIPARTFDEAIEKVILGERTLRRPDPSERVRVAVHEAGHALISEILRPGSVAAVTVAPRGGALGYVRHAPDRDRYLETREEIEADISVALAGMVAEECCLGSRSSGAQGDFDQAFEAARRLVLGGMSDLGVVTRDMISQEALSDVSRSILSRIEAQVRQNVASNKKTILDVASSLLENERIDGETLRVTLGLGRGTRPFGNLGR